MISLSKFQSRLDRGAPAWIEAAWLISKPLFFLTPVPLPSALRAAFLRLFGAKIGERMVIRHGVDIHFPWRFIAGDDVWIGQNVRILSLAMVTLESNVCLSQEVFLCTGSHDYKQQEFPLIAKPIVIKAGTWIAARSFIGPGVVIGPSAVTAACSVVMKDVAAGTIVGGNPARTLHNPG